MRSIVLTLTLTLALFTLLTACSKEEAPQTTPAKSPAIQAAEKAAAIADMSTAEKNYQSSCAACHDTGAMHAPKIGDKEDWAGHIDHGLAHMTPTAISGIGKRPPKGGNMKLSDAEVKAVVVYMVEQSR